MTAINDIRNEVARQHALWGEQDHPIKLTPTESPHDYGMESAARYRASCEWANERNQLTWIDILVEEVAEVIEATTTAEQRDELVQVAAVCVSAINYLDRNA